MSIVIELFALRPWMGRWRYLIIRLLTFHLTEGGRLYSLFAMRPNFIDGSIGLAQFNGVRGYEIQIFGFWFTIRGR